MTRILPEETPNHPMSWEDRQKPPGLRKNAKKVEQEKAAEEEKAMREEKHTGTTDGTPVGQPVGSEGTTSGEEKRFREEVTPPEQFETVVEAQLGGGEKTIYSAKDGPPLNAQDPTPRS